VAEALIVWNPAARRTPSAALEWLTRAGWRTDVIRAPGRLEQTAAAADAVRRALDLIVVVGGDGTLAAVAQELAGTQIGLGVLPGGTGNLVAANLGLPSDPVAASRLLTAGSRRAVDLGRVENEVGARQFIVACGVGFDAVVMAATSDARKRRFGRLAYAATALSAAPAIRNRPISLTVDGRTWETEAAQVMIANMGAITRQLRPRAPICPDDGLLDVLVMRGRGIGGGLVAGARLLLSAGAGHPNRGSLSRFRGARIGICTRDLQPAELDGDPFGHAPLTASVLPGAIFVMVPRP
jgi:YegS/Rv2252/BmrU family lipid kinase